MQSTILDICIIIPVYNAENFLVECLDSIRKQTYPHWRCILVNDGSIDNSQKIIDEYCSIDSRFVCFVKENEKSASLARRYALERINTEWVLCVDADDAIAPDFIEILVERQLETNADIVICRRLRCKDGFRSGGVLWQLPLKNFDMQQILSGKDACLLTIGGWNIGSPELVRHEIVQLIIPGPYMNSDEYEQREKLLLAKTVAFADAQYFFRANIGTSDKVSVRMFDRTLVDIQLEEFVHKNFPDRKDKIKALFWQRLFNLIYLSADFELNKSSFTQDESKKIDAILYYSYNRIYKIKTIVAYPLHGISLLFGYKIFKTISTFYVKYKRSHGGTFYYQ